MNASKSAAKEIPPVLIQGPLVSLKPVSLDWLDDFHEYSVKDKLYDHLEYEPFQTLHDSQNYLNELITKSSSTSAQYWFIHHTKRSRVIGTICLHSLNSRRASAEIGYGLSPDWWGLGMFNASARLVLDYAFNDLSLHRIVARTSVRNLASLRGLDRLGFQKEGLMRQYYRSTTGEWIDAVLLSKLSTDMVCQ